MQTTPDKPLSHWVVLLLALSTGVAVASNYYAQPLLHTIATDLDLESNSLGSIITIAQLSYAAGLILLVPLGDLLEKRGLIVGMSLASMSGLVISACAQNIIWLLVGTAVAGFFSVVAQVILPFAVALSKPSARGKVVGTIMGGLLLGILLARTAAGLSSSFGNWRNIYIIAAMTLFSISLLLLVILPRSPAVNKMSYLSLLTSTLKQFVLYPKLIIYSMLGALNFATFSILWTPSALLLAGKPYYYNDAIIGLFGLVGAAGALMAPYAGKLADRGKSNLTITLGFILLVLAWLPLGLGISSIIALTVGILLLDLAVQSIHVTSMNQIYQLNSESRNRLNACYMVCYFLGGALGSFGSTHIFARWGWFGVVIAGATTALLALLLWIIFHPAQTAKLTDD